MRIKPDKDKGPNPRKLYVLIAEFKEYLKLYSFSDAFLDLGAFLIITYLIIK